MGDLLETLAGWGEKLGRSVGLGSMYDDMGKIAGERMQGLSDTTYNTAIAQGKTPAEALALANQALGDTGNIISNGLGTANDAVTNAMSPDVAATAMPLLIGAGVLGAGALALNAFSGSGSPPPPPQPRRRSREQ